MKAIMIGMSDNDVSNYYMDRTIPSWEDVGIDVILYEAITPRNLDQYNYLTFINNCSRKYIKNKIKKEITPSERGCFYSHLEVLKLIDDREDDFIVLEHDAYLCDPNKFLKVFDQRSNYDIMYFGQSVECYWLNKSSIKKYLQDVVKDPIDCGPLASMEWHFSKRKKYHGWLNSPLMVTQLYNPNKGRTIDHYEGKKELIDLFADNEHLAQSKMLWITE